MAASKQVGEGRGGGDVPLLPAGSVRSLVTINPPPCEFSSLSASSLPSRVVRRRFPIDLSRSAPPSVALASFGCGEGNEEKGCGTDGERTTLVATCIPPGADDNGASDHDKCKSRNGRISFVTIAESAQSDKGRECRVVGMKYTSKDSPSFSTVCIATLSGNASRQNAGASALLVAIDTSGRLHTCNLGTGSVGSQSIGKHNTLDMLDMRECLFNDTGGATPMRGKRSKSPRKSTKNRKADQSLLSSLGLANTLTARLESGAMGGFGSLNRSTIAKSPTKSPTTGKGRKRKLSPSKKGASSDDTAGEPTTQSGRIYLIASTLNQSIPVSHSPPTVMMVSAAHFTNNGSPVANDSGANERCTGLAWSKIPDLGDVDVPMTSILFASRSMCGPEVWDGIISAMNSSNASDGSIPPGLDGEECDAGVILMGFKDGSLRASLLVTDRDSANATLEVSNATTILQLSADEPLASLQLLPVRYGSTTSASTTPLLLCLGALGSVVTLFSHGLKRPATTPKFVVQRPLAPCRGRWMSMMCIGYRFKEDSNPRIDLSVVGTDDSRRTFLHHLSLPGNPDQSNSRVDGESSHSAGCERTTARLPISARVSSSIHSHPGLEMPGIFAVSAPSGKVAVLMLPSYQMAPGNDATLHLLGGVREHMEKPEHKSGPSTMDALLEQLRSAIVKQHGKEANQALDSTSHQSTTAVKQIRDATNLAALVKKSPPRNMPPVQCVMKKLGILECNVNTKSVAGQASSTWLPSVHILQTCIQSLSPALRPESITSMTPLCYRRSSRRNEKPMAVVYGGTATSYSCGGSVGGLTDIEAPWNDFTPVSAYASLSMIYANLHEEGDDWCKSTKFVSRSDADQSELYGMAGAAKRGSSLRIDTFGKEPFLGLSLPFELNAETAHPLTFDILSNTMISDNHRAGIYPGKDEDPRDVAEKLVQQSYQNVSPSPSNLMAALQEQQMIRTFANCGSTDLKVHCCSSSMQCASTARNANALMPFGAISIVKGGSQVGFAFGSDAMTSNETMAILPLIRRAIVRQCLEQSILSRSNKARPIPVELYYHILSEKQTAKITRYISRSSEELLAGHGEEEKGKLSKDISAAAISLYEILRAIV